MKADGLEELAEVTKKLVDGGLKDLVIDSGARKIGKALEDQVTIRRLALQKQFKPLGFPTIALPCEMTEDPMMEALYAASFINKYAGIIVLSDFQGQSLFPLLVDRLNIYTEPICIALAMKTGKAVKMECTKEEDFITLETRTPAKYHVKMGFKKEGALTAIQLKLTTWAGAYTGRSQLVGRIMLIWGLGHYRCPHRAGEVYNIFTNTPMSGAMRGYGNPEIMWGIEQTMDMAAEKLGMDPVELRLRNILKVGELSKVGLPIESTGLEKCIRLGAERIEWRGKRRKKQKNGPKRRGVGLATASQSSGTYPVLLEHSNALLKFNEDGSVALVVHPGSPGTGIWGALCQIAAEEMGIRAEDIHVVTGDTDVTLFDLGSHASRSTYVIGNAVLMAARQAKSQLLERASKMLGVPASELEARDGQVYGKGNPGKGISIAEIARNAMYGLDGESLNISGKCSWEPKSNPIPTAAYFAEVEVDTETGEITVLKFITAIDSGRPINPMTVEGQAEGAIEQGIGYALTEDYVINQTTGVVETNNFDTYKIPSIADMPETEVVLVEAPDPTGPFGAKGMGEMGSVGVAPAIANAIYDAVGVRIKEMPITPDKVLKAMEQKNRDIA